jgi:hypothetical protein
MAFETRMCRSFPSAQSLYTVEVQTRRRLAASRTERSLGHAAICDWADCNPGVTRGLSKPPKIGATSASDVDLVPVVPDGCEELPFSATSSPLPVTPKATGLRPSEAHQLGAAKSVPWDMERESRYELEPL